MAIGLVSDGGTNLNHSESHVEGLLLNEWKERVKGIKSAKLFQAMITGKTVTFALPSCPVEVRGEFPFTVMTVTPEGIYAGFTGSDYPKLES